MSITGGSCFLEAAVNDSRVVEVIQSPPGMQCFHLTLSPKGLGTALVTVYDIGLAPTTAASAVVLCFSFSFFSIMPSNVNIFSWVSVATIKFQGLIVNVDNLLS